MKSNLRYLSLILGLLVGVSAHAQAPSIGSIEGRVFNPATGEYVRDAEVRIRGTDMVAHTEQDGSFRFHNVPAGEVTLGVAYTGYLPATDAFNVSPGSTATREIQITSSATGAKPGADLIKMGDFVVSSDREGNAKAIMEQRRNMNIATSVASDVFGDILDGNVGEFIKYLPGVDVESMESRAYLPRLGGLEPNFTGVSIDGGKIAGADSQLQYANVENSGGTGEYASVTGFDQVSLNSVESIEISATLSPDMDANSPAGRINMKTKRAFDLKGRRITYQLGATMNSNEFHLKKTYGPLHEEEYKVRPNYQLGYSESFLKNRLGVQLSISQARTYDEYHRVTFGLNRTRTAADQRPVVINQIIFKDGPNLANRFGATFTGDFKVTPQFIVGLNVIFNGYKHSQDGSNSTTFNLASNNTNAATGRQNVLGDGLTELRTNGLANNTNRTVAVGSLPAFKSSNTITYTPKFEWRRGPLTLNGNYGYSHGKTNYTALGIGYAAINIPALGGVDFVATRPSTTSAEWTITQTGGPDWSDLANFRGNTNIGPDQGRFMRVDLHDAQLDAKFNLPFRLPSFVKFGGKYNDDVRKSTDVRPFNRYTYTGPGAGPGGSWAAFPSRNAINMDVGSQNWLRIANMPTRANSQAVGALYLEHPEWFRPNGTAEQYYEAYVGNDRDFRQSIVAGYGMGNVRIGRVQIQGGLRWEGTTTESKEWNPLTAAQVQAAGYAVNATTRRATTVEGMQYQFFTQPRVRRKAEYDNLFPSISTKVNFTPNFNAHFGYNRSISRPPVNALSGVWEIDDLNARVNAPNPDLKPADSDKFVARLAYYFEPVGSLTLQISQNDITNLRSAETFTADEFGFGSDPSWSGYDFVSVTNDSKRRRLRSLEAGYNQALSFLPGVLRGLNVNFAYTRNYANVRRLGVSPHRISGNLAWNWNRVSLRLGGVWMDETPWSAGNNIVGWRIPGVRYDLGGSYRLHKRATLFFQGRNILNESMFIYQSLTGVQGEAPILQQARNHGANWLFGVKGTF
jgi:TonB-dependent receptor